MVWFFFSKCVNAIQKASEKQSIKFIVIYSIAFNLRIPNFNPLHTLHITMISCYLVFWWMKTTYRYETAIASVPFSKQHTPENELKWIAFHLNSLCLYFYHFLSFSIFSILCWTIKITLSQHVHWFCFSIWIIFMTQKSRHWFLGGMRLGSKT